MRSTQPTTDIALAWLLRGAAVVSTAIVLLIVAFLCVESQPAFRAVGLSRFATDPSWHPAAGPAAGRFNLLPMIAGTLVVSVGALALATPLGVLSAVFSRFYAPAWLAGGFRRIVQLLAGIPSVVYGLWGLVVLVPIIARWQPPGPSVLAGVFVLGLMVLPTIALVCDASLAAVPRPYLQGAAALGLSRWGTVWGVALPAARRGVFTAVLLGTARALGETMAVLMVCGNVVQVPASVFDPVRTLTANIALEMAYALDVHRSALFVSGLALLGAVSLLVLIAEMSGRGRVDA
jgi:phosphate transport system permease protein